MSQFFRFLGARRAKRSGVERSRARSVRAYRGEPAHKTARETAGDINGFPVKSIGKGAFDNGQGLYSGLTSVILLNSITNIGKDAFSTCRGLVQVLLGTNIANIGSNAFFGCAGLTNVSIPASAGNLGTQAFGRCLSLKEIAVDGSSSAYSSVDGVLFDKDQTTLIQYPSGKTGSYAVPATVNRIGSGSFAYSHSLTNLDISADVTEIGSQAFNNCSNLATFSVEAGNPAYHTENGVLFDDRVASLVRYPEGRAGEYTVPSFVSIIADEAFYQATGLTKVSVGDGVTHIGSRAFALCSSLVQATIPPGVTYIGDEAFSLCGSLLGSVTIPGSVAYLGSDAFSFCSGLRSVTIEDGVTNVAAQAFEYCTNVAEVTLGRGVASIDPFAFLACGSLTNISLPDSVTNIGAGAFESCAGLTNVSLGSQVTAIDDFAFQNCYTLASINVPSSVTSIGNYAFDGCSRLRHITIPVGIGRIGDYALAFTGLIDISMPQSVTNVGRGAFYACSQMTNIGWSSNVVVVEAEAFEGCTSLTELNLPDGLTSIGDYGFYYCVSVSNIVIPATVTNLGSFAFSTCPQLRGLFFRGDAPVADHSVADGDTQVTAYYLPGTTGWQEFVASTGLPVVLWNPQIETNDGQFGIRNNEFGFNVTGTTNIPVVIEACTDIGLADWGALQETVLTNGIFHFRDPNWMNHPSRLYRLRSP